tara:strand:- start:65 stop:175 length:111 start_codon:yes stop_codon:yes gene_type:complete
MVMTVRHQIHKNRQVTVQVVMVVNTLVVVVAGVITT